MVETSSLSEDLCLANSADSWSIATTTAAGFSVVKGDPAVVGGLLAAKDASLPTASVAGVCKLTYFAHLDMLISEKFVKLNSAAKIMSKSVQRLRSKGRVTKREPGAFTRASSPYMLQPEVPY